MISIIDTGKDLAQVNMDFDAKLLEELSPNGDPILHLYEWEGLSASYGHFVDPYTYLSKEGVQEVSLNLAKRPTGGGIVLHTSDYAFSCLLPSEHPKFSINTLENYELVNKIVIDALSEVFGDKLSCQLLPFDPKPKTPSCQFFCMAKATKYDVMIGDKKIGGAAQRRKKQGFLHQGTISLAAMPKKFLETILIPESGVYSAMVDNTYTLLGSDWIGQDLEELRKKLKEQLKLSFKKCFS